MAGLGGGTFTGGGFWFSYIRSSVAASWALIRARTSSFVGRTTPARDTRCPTEHNKRDQKTFDT